MMATASIPTPEQGRAPLWIVAARGVVFGIVAVSVNRGGCPPFMWL